MACGQRVRFTSVAARSAGIVRSRALGLATLWAPVNLSRSQQVTGNCAACFWSAQGKCKKLEGDPDEEYTCPTPNCVEGEPASKGEPQMCMEKPVRARAQLHGRICSGADSTVQLGFHSYPPPPRQHGSLQTAFGRLRRQRTNRKRNYATRRRRRVTLRDRDAPLRNGGATLRDVTSRRALPCVNPAHER